MKAVQVLETALTVTAAAYSSGHMIGGLMTLAFNELKGVNAIIVDQVRVIDEAKQSANVDLVLFSSNPSGTTFTDKTTLDVADADLSKIAAVIPLTTHSVFNDNGVSMSAFALGCLVPVKQRITGGQTIYAALVSRATPTFAATTDVSVQIVARPADQSKGV